LQRAYITHFPHYSHATCLNALLQKNMEGYLTLPCMVIISVAAE